MIRNNSAGRKRPVASLALETYWSRGAIAWGKTLAVRYLLRPAASSGPTADAESTSADYLRRDLARRLNQGELEFDLCIQRFVDEAKTPIEDTAIEWLERNALPEKVATLTIPKQDVGSVEALSTEQMIDAIAFNPWNTTEEFRPLGNLNRARKVVYDASAAHRLIYRWEAEPPPLRNRLIGRPLYSFLGSHPAHRLAPAAAVFSLLCLDAFRSTCARRT